MAKDVDWKGVGASWATLMPVFSPRVKDSFSFQEWDSADGPIIFYGKPTNPIMFSTSVLDAMDAEAPAPTPPGILVEAIWDGPKVFEAYVLQSAISNYPGGITSAASNNLSPSEKVKMHNDFLLNCGMYVFDVSTGLMIPNPDYDMATKIIELDFGDSALGEFIDFCKGREEFCKLLQPENYGFSTTLIYPNQNIVDEDDEDDEDDKKTPPKKKNPYGDYDEFIKRMKDEDPWGKPKINPWPEIDPYNPPPYAGKQPYAPNKSWDWDSGDYKDYRDSKRNKMSPEEFKKWVGDQYDAYEKFKGFWGPNSEANK
jgi:hypothetical protein